jgi:hypothetical protein
VVLRGSRGARRRHRGLRSAFSRGGGPCSTGQAIVLLEAAVFVFAARTAVAGLVAPRSSNRPSSHSTSVLPPKRLQGRKTTVRNHERGSRPFAHSCLQTLVGSGAGPAALVPFTSSEATLGTLVVIILRVRGGGDTRPPQRSTGPGVSIETSSPFAAPSLLLEACLDRFPRFAKTNRICSGRIQAIWSETETIRGLHRVSRDRGSGRQTPHLTSPKTRRAEWLARSFEVTRARCLR